MPKRSNVRYLMEYGAVRAPMAAMRALPFPAAFRVGEKMGDALFRAARPQRRVAEINLRIAFPENSDEDRLAIYREACRNMGRMVAEFCHMKNLTPENLHERVVFDDPADWEEKKKRIGTTGVLVLGGHFGNWELQAYAFGLLGTPIHFIHRPFHNPYFTELVGRERGRAGTGLISKRSAALEVVRVLRNNGIVGIPFDQNATGRWGVFVDFFGVPASTHPGLARLAMMANAPVYPAFLVRENGGHRHRIHVGDEIPVARTGDAEADVRATLQRFSDAFEAAVRAHPDHWIWLHKRWKTRPPGEPPIY